MCPKSLRQYVAGLKLQPRAAWAHTQDTQDEKTTQDSERANETIAYQRGDDLRRTNRHIEEQEDHGRERLTDEMMIGCAGPRGRSRR